MKRFLLIAAACLALAACNKPAGPAPQNVSNIGSVEVLYTVDPRTGLCFASGWEGSYHGGPWRTQVPCTKEVREMLGEPPVEPPPPILTRDDVLQRLSPEEKKALGL